jgi:predicted transcriptional regulator
MTDKQTVLQTVNKLPDTAKLDDILANLTLLAKIHEGVADADAGRVVAHEQIKRELRSWISS